MDDCARLELKQSQVGIPDRALGRKVGVLRVLRVVCFKLDRIVVVERGGGPRPRRRWRCFECSVVGERKRPVCLVERQATNHGMATIDRPVGVSVEQQGDGSLLKPVQIEWRGARGWTSTLVSLGGRSLDGTGHRGV